MRGPVFVTGGSGFVGAAVIDELLGRDYAVRALVNRAELSDRGPRLTCVRGGLFDADALRRGLDGCAAVIHLVGIIREKPSAGITFDRIHYQGTVNVVDAAGSAGARRYVHMSALGARPDAVSQYHRTKFKAEQYVRSGGLDWTILRPSLIHGANGEFMRTEARWARRTAAPFLFMPYFGGGAFGGAGAGRLQPVYVKDVARAFVDALEHPATIGRTYDLAGPDPLTWPQLHEQSARVIVGRRRAVLPLPVWYARLLTRLVPAALLPFNRDQVQMSQEDNTADLGPFVADFGWTPRPFAQTLSEYAAQL